MKIKYNSEEKILLKKLTGKDFETLLEKKGLTKWRVAKDCGLSWRTIYNWAKNRGKPNKENIWIVAKYLELINQNDAERQKEIEELKKRIQRLE